MKYLLLTEEVLHHNYIFNIQKKTFSFFNLHSLEFFHAEVYILRCFRERRKNTIVIVR